MKTENQKRIDELTATYHAKEQELCSLRAKGISKLEARGRMNQLYSLARQIKTLTDKEA